MGESAAQGSHPMSKTRPRVLALLALLLAVRPLSLALAGDAVTECDRLASNPEDPDRRAPAVPREKMDLPKAIAVCEQEHARSPGDPRAHYQLARSLIYAGQNERGVAEMKRAADAGDRQSQFVYGLLISRERAAAPRDICIAEPYWLKSARQGRQAARVSYVHHVVRGRFARCPVQASNDEMRGFLASAAKDADNYYEKILIEDLQEDLARR
jgi:hypothetical protein